MSVYRRFNFTTIVPRKLSFCQQGVGASTVCHPTEERGQHEGQIPQQPRDQETRTNSTSWYPSKLVELTALRGSSTDVHYYPCQEFDLCSGQATGGGLSEQVPIRSGLQLKSEQTDAIQASGFRYPIQETNGQDRAVEHTCTVLEQEQRSSPPDALLTEGRACNGIFIWKIHNFSQYHHDAINGVITALYSPPIYTHLYGYKLRMLLYLNGVHGSVGKYVRLFVQMMESENDDILAWPFAGRITLSILDQSGAEFRDDISGIILAKPSLSAFQKPTASNSHSQGYGFEEFAPIQQVCGVRYTKNDIMMVKIEITRA
ncbi:hypothetical protein ACROYT_G032756 [Oculina patagonica]